MTTIFQCSGSGSDVGSGLPSSIRTDIPYDGIGTIALNPANSTLNCDDHYVVSPSNLQISLDPGNISNPLTGNVFSLGNNASFLVDVTLVLGRRLDILGELRARGFARGDTEQMRLILEAFENLASPTRRTRRLMRRPYFPDARLFFEITAPTYSIDATHLMRWLSDPNAFAIHPTNPDAANPPSAQPSPNGQRRRRRRRRRTGRTNNAPLTTANSAEDAHGGDPSPQSQEPTRRQ